MGKTTWDKIVSDQDLAKARASRSKTYITSKERAGALDALLLEGWEFVKNYADNRFISVKRNKPVDEVFEDKVWSLFAKMGFTHMNSDRHFVMAYDPRNSNDTQQIDIFAADDESIIIVECKASNSDTPQEGVFKKDIEALHGQMEGLAKEARSKFPGRKIKFIWATHNYILNKADQQRLKEWEIIHFSDAVVDYYLDLTKHLGTSAKYQFLGNVFANVEIKNMDDRIPAIQGEMGGFKYYSFSIEPERLLKIGYVLHRNEANKNMMPTYQRLIKKARLKSVQQFVNDGGYFPNSIIISIDTNGRGLKFEPSSTKVEGCISKLGVLYLPKRYRSAYIIDGQHRLYGYSDSLYAKNNTIPVVAFVDLEREEQIKLFMDINENQKAVPKTLRVTLNSDMLWESPNYNERRKALRSKIAQMLGEEETSPLLDRIVIGENETLPTRCITVEAIQNALNKCDFFTVFGKKNVIVKDGTFDLGGNQETCDLFYPFIEECLKYVMQNAEREWNKGEQEYGLLTINRGIQGLLRIINDIVNLLIASKHLSPKQDKIENLLTQVKFYLDPLIDYFNNLTFDQRKDLRGYFGGNAEKRFWRTFQKVIADNREDFIPDGLKEYWDNEAKLYNQESLQFLTEIRKNVKNLFERELGKFYGKDWLIKALPKTIYTRAKTEADDQNYDLISSGQSGDEISIWDCVNLTDCKTIATIGNHWTSIFERFLVRPEEIEISGGKEAKTEWLSKIETIFNKIQRMSYSVTEAEFELIKSIHLWICSNN
ncbi:MAG: DGQHR domain-containing protein [Clostridia bacterium]|nr:DGQHR domain-containing protein [Clostridia bacterium]